MSNINSRKYYQYYTLQEIALMNNPYRFQAKNFKSKQPIEETLKQKDDELKTNTWTELYKSAAYYFDNPTIEEKTRAFNSIRFNFSGILSETNNPNDLPPTKNRNDLINWVCVKNNEFLEKLNSSNRIECDTEKLLNTFGPNYLAAKEYLGSYDF